MRFRNIKNEYCVFIDTWCCNTKYIIIREMFSFDIPILFIRIDSDITVNLGMERTFTARSLNARVRVSHRYVFALIVTLKWKFVES